MNSEILKFERISSIRISRKYENEVFYSSIKNYLTRRVKNYNSESYTTNIFYIESEKYLHIPRYFPIHDFTKCEVMDMQHEGSCISITSKIVPRNDLQKNAINHMMTNENSLIELQPGVGKTVISIKVISELKKKTIILTHRDSLVQQWKSRICEFTDMNEEDISVLTSKNFEQDLIKPIIVATVQTFLSLIKRKYEIFVNALYSANIGIMIADEIHTSVGAPTFSECSLYIPAKRIYGLSATPYRSDGNADVMSYHLGPTFTETDVSGTMACKIYIVLFDYEIDLPSKRRYMYWDGVFQKSRYLNGMVKSIPFNAIAKQMLMKMYSDDRDIIFVADRIKVLDEMLKIKEIKDEDKTQFIAGSKNKVLSTKVVLSTPGKIRDGVDCPQKDTLIMTSSISNISQITGRVIRSHENKKQPLIFDMVDIGCKPVRKTLFKRITFYEEKEWEIIYMYIDPLFNKSIISREEALKKI